MSSRRAGSPRKPLELDVNTVNIVNTDVLCIRNNEYLGFCRPDLTIENTIGKGMDSSATKIETSGVRQGLEVENSIGMETSANTVDVGKNSAGNTNGGLGSIGMDDDVVKSSTGNTDEFDLELEFDEGLEDSIESCKNTSATARNTNVMMIDVMKVCETPQVNTEEVSIVGYVSPSKPSDQPEVKEEEMQMGFYLEILLDQIENLQTLEEITTFDEEEFAVQSARNIGRVLEIMKRLELYMVEM